MTSQFSMNSVAPIARPPEAMKSIVRKLDWFKDSKVKLNVSGVLFKETLDEMGQVINLTLSMGIPVHARVIHDDLVHDRALRDASATGPLLRFLSLQEKLKRSGEKIHSSWNLFAYQKKMLRQEPVEWTCIAGYKYFFSLIDRQVLALQFGANREAHSWGRREDLVGSNRKEGLPGGIPSSLPPQRPHWP